MSAMGPWAVIAGEPEATTANLPTPLEPDCLLTVQNPTSVGPARVEKRKCIELKHVGSVNYLIGPLLSLGPAWVVARGPAAGALKVLIYNAFFRPDPSLRNDGVTGSNPVSGTIPLSRQIRNLKRRGLPAWSAFGSCLGAFGQWIWLKRGRTHLFAYDTAGSRSQPHRVVTVERPILRPCQQNLPFRTRQQSGRLMERQLCALPLFSPGNGHCKTGPSKIWSMGATIAHKERLKANVRETHHRWVFFPAHFNTSSDQQILEFL